MANVPTTIADLFHVRGRFHRSVQLERDFRDPRALDGYIVTEAMAHAFQRIAEGLRPDAGARAWRITGDYGVGKSAFALVLAHLLRRPDSPAVTKIAAAAAWPRGEDAPPPMWPILITGSREGAARAIAVGVVDALDAEAPQERRQTATLRAQAAAAGGSGSVREVEALIVALRDHADGKGLGLLLVLDELGKLLEHAAYQPDQGDVFVLQRLAELASRSGERPFLVLGLLHQGFHAYAESLPTVTRHEWDKIAGRFEEIVFDQPLAHTAALIAGVLGVNTDRLPKPVLQTARHAAEAIATMGWLSGGTSGALVLDAAALYPAHPSLLPPLVRFFARFGQHERSLFGFLLSAEPGALQAYSARPLASGGWYGLPELYDYIRMAFGHRLAGESYRSHWLRISSLVDAAEDFEILERRVLKAIAVLNLIDAEDLLPTDAALAACLSPAPARAVSRALQSLLARGLVHRRGAHGGYRLWPNSSVNLQVALDLAERRLPGLERVAPHLLPYLAQEPLLARRHYIERGTLRYFEVRYADVGRLPTILDVASTADGTMVVALADTEAERDAALTVGKGTPFKDREDVLVGVGEPLIRLRAELREVQLWRWIQENTPELSHDSYAAAEVARELAAARRALTAKLASLSGFRSSTGGGITWLYQGRTRSFTGGVAAGLSEVCDELFPMAPWISNELINRNTLSSAASAARMRLIEGMFDRSDQAILGIDTKKAPPERSMYLSVLQKGCLHVAAGDRWVLCEPAGKDDPLHLQPAVGEIFRLIEAGRGDRVPVAAIFERLRRPPYGVRAGVTPLLLALVLRVRSHEVALYEDGTFLPRVTATDFLRLTKTPQAFEVQHCRIEGVRIEVFARLAEAFAGERSARRPEILDVVTPLCRFAAELPEYTRRAGALSAVAAAVRDALLNAREPATLLFRDLPVSCGNAPFDPDTPAERGRAHRFVADLQRAIEELTNAYPHLVNRLIDGVAEALGEGGRALDRARLAGRAARVFLAAREPRLRTFAARLRDPGLTDEAWIEALASFVVARPPKRWAVGEEARFLEDVGALAEVFCRVEAAAFDQDESRPAATAVRLNLTRGDGADVVRIVMPEPLDHQDAQSLEALRNRLPQAPRLRIQFLTELLWSELHPRALDEPATEATAARKSS